MNILIFAPYGFENRAAGAALFLAKYLRTSFTSVRYLTCDGAFSQCARDDSHAGARTNSQCLQCHSEQRRFASWVEGEELSLAKSIARVAPSVRDELVQLKPSSIGSATYRGMTLNQFLRPVIRSERFRRSSENERTGLLVSSAYHSAELFEALGELLGENQIDLILSAAQEDFLGQAVLAAAKRRGVAVAEFRSPEGEQIQVIHPREGRMFRCNLTLGKLMRMRSEPREWPKEIRETLSQMSRFLGFQHHQMELLRSNQ
jgi:hypothetical protein